MSKYPTMLDREIGRKERALEKFYEKAELMGELNVADDDLPVGTVATWTVRFVNPDEHYFGREVYSYTAIKDENGKWYTSGAACDNARGYTWEALIEKLMLRQNTVLVDGVWFVSEWVRELPEEKP